VVQRVLGNSQPKPLDLTAKHGTTLINLSQIQTGAVAANGPSMSKAEQVR
jgi:histidine ammonia-lyase